MSYAFETGDMKLSKSLPEFKYMSFDVVGTLIDFEGGLTSCLSEIAAEAGVTIDGEEALRLYRSARYAKDADLFPDDLVRVYLAIAPALGLPVDKALGERLRDSDLQSITPSHVINVFNNGLALTFFDPQYDKPADNEGEGHWHSVKEMRFDHLAE